MVGSFLNEESDSGINNKCLNFRPSLAGQASLPRYSKKRSCLLSEPG
jgi:hypothetical protein